MNANIFEDQQTAAQRRKSMKRLSCRKCEGHGFYAILKGHAPVCPFNECTCETCSAVMSMRANALIRRFRHRKPDHNNALLKTIRSKNGNMRLRILPKTQETPEDTSATQVTYNKSTGGRGVSVRSSSVASASSSASTLSSGSCSPAMAAASPLPAPLGFVPTQFGMPSGDVINDYIQQLLLSTLVGQMPLGNPVMPTLGAAAPQFLLPQTSSDLLYAQSLLLSSLTSQFAV